MAKSNRVYYLDTICGILILHMIFIIHLPHFVGTECPSWIIFKGPKMVLDFFMSWFFFKSGMFFKEKKRFMKLLRQVIEDCFCLS